MAVAPISSTQSSFYSFALFVFPCVSAAGDTEGGEGRSGCVYSIRVFTFAFFFSMDSSFSTSKIDGLVKNLDRPQLLAFLGVNDSTEQVGDFEAIRSISASTVNPIVIFKSDVPFLNKINAECCSGAIIRRFKNATVGVPCFSHEVEAGNNFCDVCSEVWKEPDSRGFYRLDVDSMPNAAEFYAPAKQGVLWKLPMMTHMQQFFEDEINVVRDIFDGSESELPLEWPNRTFEEVSADILLRSGVLHRDADKSRNPYRRDKWEHIRIGEYLRKMISCWLRMRTVIDADELSREVKALHRTAKSIGLASMWRVQREHRRIPILVGPLVPADIMLAGFRHACAGFRVLVHNISVESEDEMKSVPEFQWGEHVEMAREWASHVKLLRRPNRKSAPKYSPDDRTPKKQSNSSKFKNASASTAQSPSAVKAWYAAKETSRPGAYVHKHVADSYNADGKGIVKKFKTLAEVRSWLQMPSPRIFYENTVKQEPHGYKDTTGGSVEFIGLKGGSRAGVYSSFAEAITARDEGGGTYAIFTSEAEAREFIRAEDTYVVWAGREVGIMSKDQCVAATQKLSAAKMRGPMSEEAAFELWSQVQPSASIVTAKTAKKSRKKKKRFYYAVAVGKVPGVYDDWKEAERQVKGVRPNLYAKCRRQVTQRRQPGRIMDRITTRRKLRLKASSHCKSKLLLFRSWKQQKPTAKCACLLAILTWEKLASHCHSIKLSQVYLTRRFKS